MKAEIKERIDKINRGQVPEGYKKTREGIIPYEWKIEKLGKYVTIHSGDSPSKFKFCSTGVSYFKVDDLNNCDKYLANSELKIDEKDLKKIVPKNSLIFPKRGASILTNKVRILKENSFFDTNLMGIEPNEEKINYEFLYYLILEKGLYKIADTSTIPQLNNKHIEPLLVVLPNVSEQKRIAQVLSTWDKAIELKEKLIEQKKEQKKGLMQRLLTGKVRLPGFKGEWKEVRLKQILEVRNEKSEITGDLELYSLTIEEGVTPKTDRYNREYLVKDDNKQYKITYKDDIVYNPSNLRFGAIAINKIQKPVLLSPIYEVLFIKDTSKYDVSFIAQLLTSDRQIRIFSTMAEGTLIERKAVKVDAFLNTAIYIPQDIKEQKAISKIIGCYERGIELLQQELEALKQQKKGLMQLLLTGKVRVKC